MKFMINFVNLKKFFGGVRAVDGCSFEIEKGKITALIGPNGSGKTTIFNLISGIIKPDEGHIFFNDNDLSRLSVEEISNLGVSRIFQQSRLFKNLTVRENLLLAFDNEDVKFFKNVFGLNKISKEKEIMMEKIMDDLDISELREKIADDLSFGQKRLVELARAILNPHKILILDEPVAGVNPKIRGKIGEILKNLKNKGETILLIEHDMQFVFNLADYVVAMNVGKVIARGSVSEIKGNPAVLESYLGE